MKQRLLDRLAELDDKVREADQPHNEVWLHQVKQDEKKKQILEDRDMNDLCVLTNGSLDSL